MKYDPKCIVLSTIYKYMDETAIENLKKDLAKISLRSNKKFLELIYKHFDIEILRTKPLIREDVYIYNYLTLEVTNRFSKDYLYSPSPRTIIKFKRSGLIAKYEKFLIKEATAKFLREINLNLRY